MSLGHAGGDDQAGGDPEGGDDPDGGAEVEGVGHDAAEEGADALAGVAPRAVDANGGNLMDDFCSGANLFCTIEHLERWAGGSRGAGSVMTIDEVAEVGRAVWADAANLLTADQNG